MKSHIDKYAKASLVGTAIILLLGSITHAYKYGYPAFIVGFLLICAIYLLNSWFRRSGNKGALFVYGFLNVWIIGGLGLLDSFWNHTVKVTLYYLHNESLPPFLAQMFSDSHVGSFWYETIGILTFIASMVSAYTGYKLVQTMRDSRRTINQEE